MNSRDATYLDSLETALGRRTMADMLGVMADSREILASMPVGDRIGLNPLLRHRVDPSSQSDISSIVLGYVLGSESFFITGPIGTGPVGVSVRAMDGEVGGISPIRGRGAAERIASLGIRWMVDMLSSFLRLVAADPDAVIKSNCGMRAISRVDDEYDGMAAVAEAVLGDMMTSGRMPADPSEFADVLEKGMADSYRLEETHGSISPFSTLELHRRWCSAVESDAADPPRCAIAPGFPMRMLEAATAGEYWGNGFDRVLVEAMESDGSRDYGRILSWLAEEGRLTLWTGPDALPGYHRGCVFVQGVFHMNSGLMDRMLVGVRDSPSVLAMLDFLDVLDAVAVMDPWLSSDGMHQVDAPASIALSAARLLRDGLPHDMAAERMEFMLSDLPATCRHS